MLLPPLLLLLLLVVVVVVVVLLLLLVVLLLVVVVLVGVVVLLNNIAQLELLRDEKRSRPLTARPQISTKDTRTSRSFGGGTPSGWRVSTYSRTFCEKPSGFGASSEHASNRSIHRSLFLVPRYFKGEYL